jgi:hypothetical protein
LEKRAVLGVVDMFVVPLPFYLVVDTYKLVLLLAASKESGIEQKTNWCSDFTSYSSERLQDCLLFLLYMAEFCFSSHKIWDNQDTKPTHTALNLITNVTVLYKHYEKTCL